MILALRLAKGAWWGGNPGLILASPADEVMLAVHYENFKGDYESEMMRIARADAK